MRALMTTACTLAVTAAGTALAQDTDQMDSSFKREIARWQVQQTAAESDVKLADQVRSDFYIAAKIASGEPQASKIDEALAPLRARYPDYRLSYRTAADYCRVSRAIGDARTTALTRINTSLTHQLKILALSQSYHRITVKMIAGDILGKPLKQSDVAEAFREELVGHRGEIQTDWDSMDSLIEPSAGEDCS